MIHFILILLYTLIYAHIIDLILNLGLNAPSYLFFLFDVQGSCVPSLAVAVPVWHCSLEIESNWFWQAASDFNASKLLRGKILSVYLASYLEIWRLWGQLKHELILTNTYDLIIPGPGLTLAADTISVSAPGLSPVMWVNLYIYRSLVRSCPVSSPGCAVHSRKITNQLPSGFRIFPWL